MSDEHARFEYARLMRLHPDLDWRPLFQAQAAGASWPRLLDLVREMIRPTLRVVRAA